MTEKIKDFIYDFSDIFLGLLIIGCMIFVISWKIVGVMDIDITHHSSNNPIEDNNDIIIENPENIVFVEPDNNMDEKASIENNEIESPPISQSTESIDIVVEIPKGTTGFGIAKILKEKGLINNTSDFINKVEEMKLGAKLRYGTFTINSNATIEEMIHIITGIK